MAAGSFEEWVTRDSVATTGGATLAVLVVTIALGAVFRAPPKPTAFVTALAVSVALTATRPEIAWLDWVFAFINGCLLFCSALGLNEIAAATAANPPGGRKDSRFAQPAVLRSWIRRR